MTSSDSDSIAAAWFAAFSSGSLAQESGDATPPISLLAVTATGAPTCADAGVARNELRIEAYGAIDEANCAIGLARLTIAADPEWARVDATLLCVQNDLFDLAADLCLPTGATPDYEPLRVVQSQVDRLERKIDELSMDLQDLHSFVLPGGSAAAAALHQARATTRRAERRLAALASAEGERIGEPALQYVNRLSHLLFVAARYVNRKGEGDILWAPGQKR